MISRTADERCAIHWGATFRIFLLSINIELDCSRIVISFSPLSDESSGSNVVYITGKWVRVKGIDLSGNLNFPKSL